MICRPYNFVVNFLMYETIRKWNVSLIFMALQLAALPYLVGTFVNQKDVAMANTLLL